jgi:hypothetical protein
MGTHGDKIDIALALAYKVCTGIDRRGMNWADRSFYFISDLFDGEDAKRERFQFSGKETEKQLAAVGFTPEQIHIIRDTAVKAAKSVCEWMMEDQNKIAVCRSRWEVYHPLLYNVSKWSHMRDNVFMAYFEKLTTRLFNIKLQQNATLLELLKRENNII